MKMFKVVVSRVSYIDSNRILQSEHCHPLTRFFRKNRHHNFETRANGPQRVLPYSILSSFLYLALPSSRAAPSRRDARDYFVSSVRRALVHGKLGQRLPVCPAAVPSIHDFNLEMSEACPRHSSGKFGREKSLFIYM